MPVVKAERAYAADSGERLACRHNDHADVEHDGLSGMRRMAHLALFGQRHAAPTTPAFRPIRLGYIEIVH